MQKVGLYWLLVVMYVAELVTWVPTCSTLPAAAIDRFENFKLVEPPQCDPAFHAFRDSARDYRLVFASA